MSEKIKAYEVDLNELRPDPSNANAGSERGQHMIDASVTETGLHRGVAVDANGYLVAGNKTHQSAIDAGFKRAIIVETSGDTLVVTKRLDFDLMDADPNNKARRAAYFDNRTSEVSMQWNVEQLFADMGAGLDLSGMFREDELDALLAEMQPEPEPVTDAGAQVDKAAELQAHWGTALGQMWQLGEHRLICGDCTDAEVVARVMQGEKAVCVVTDPPYGIGWNGNYTRFSKGGIAESSTNYDDIHGDAQPFDPSQWLGFDEVVFWGANFFGASLPVGTWLVWDKRSADGTSFLADAELAWQKGGAGVYIKSINQQSEKSKSRDIYHPTKKPIELMRWCIEGLKSTGLILDPFSGSGTTIIACEQLGRKCRAVEISPGYVAVALQRFADSTGKTPVLVE